MRRASAPAREVFNNPILIGTITILIIVVGVYLSYIAENGLPFVPTYNVYAQVAAANELVKNTDVRIGGARVGQVLTITPEPANNQYRQPYAQLKLALEKTLQPLPVDTHYQVRLASVLGGKYLELFPGSSKQGLPDGGTFTLNDNAKLSHDVPYVDIDTAFDTFGPKTQSGIRSSTQQLGTAVAGRGAEFNDAIHATAQLIGPLEHLLRLLVSPDTHLAAFISGLAATTGALAPVSPTAFGSLMTAGATTFKALDVSALGTTIDALPGTESVGTTVFTNSLPTLQDAAAIVTDLKPAAAVLPSAAQHLDTVLRAAPAVFRVLPTVASGLKSALGATDRLAKDPASVGLFHALGPNDLGTFGSSALVGLGAMLEAVAPQQLKCNVAGLWAHNLAAIVSDGNPKGSWLSISPLIDINQLLQSGTPAPDLHIDYYPTENASQCQAGNESYSGGQAIGNPGTTGTGVANTAPPAGVLALGQKAGLVP